VVYAFDHDLVTPAPEVRGGQSRPSQ
jgi:hypothetical protein